MIRTAPAFALALALAACAAVGPDYAPPQPPAAAKGAFRGAVQAPYSTDAPAGDWTRLFLDPALDALTAEALRANTDLRVAEANLRKAQALAGEARAGRWPSTTARVAVDVDESTPDPFGETDTYDAALGLSYQLDLFGKVRRTIESARAEAGAAAAARDAVRITVVAETARAYAEACNAAQRLATAEGMGVVQTRAAELVTVRRKEGAVSGLDVAQAAAALELTRAAIPALQAGRDAALFRLAVLIGRPPAGIPEAAASCAATPRVRTTIPVGDGAALIARRPDIREAERRLAAATARIGVARAELYPDISLGPAGGAGGEEWEDIDWKWTVAPLVTWTFPNRMAVKGRIGQAEASAEAALAAWDGAVLTALEEVETALSAYARELDRNAALRRADAEAGKAAERAQARYREGADGFLGVLDAQRRQGEAAALLGQSDGALARRQIDLFLALGGGWEPPAGLAGGPGRD